MSISGSSEKFVSGNVKAIEFEHEVALVAQAVGLAQQGFDLIVDAFHPSVVDAGFPPGEDATGVAQQGFAQLHHLPDPGPGGPVAPFLEEGFHALESGLFPEQSEGLLEEIISPLASFRVWGNDSFWKKENVL